MEDKTVKNIKIIKLKDKYLFTIGYIYSDEMDKYLINGEVLQKTFEKEWYVCKNEPKLLQRKVNEKINEKWELKNKELYNETIPMIIDEHTKEKYNALTRSDLYQYSYDTKEVLEDFELNVISHIELNEDIPFEYEQIIKTGDGWYGIKETKYLIERVEYSIIDNCLVPSPIKELTRPCVLPREILYDILVDYIKRNIDRNIAKIQSEYSFYIRIENIKTRRKILEWENDYEKRYTLKNLTASNFKELTEKLEAMKKDIINFINKRHLCEHCRGTGFTDEDLNLEKYY